MVYEYNPKVVNRNKPENFFDKYGFVGYILPNGEVFRCKDHNVSDAATMLFMYLQLLDTNYDNKDELLNEKTNNRLLEVVLKKLKTMSHDEIHALYDFIKLNHYMVSDLLVSYFGCHLITRLDREILTSEIDYSCFYNYLLNDFKIYNVGRLFYDKEKKYFKYLLPVVRNDYLYDEIRRIKGDVKDDEIPLFYKGK